MPEAGSMEAMAHMEHLEHAAIYRLRLEAVYGSGKLNFFVFASNLCFLFLGHFLFFVSIQWWKA